MIIIHTNYLSNSIKQDLNNFILQSFENSRINHYDFYIYYKDKGNIIGFAGLSFINNHLSINQLCFKPDFRKKRIAINIINFIKKIYKNLRIILYIEKNNLDYYLNLGFNDINIENHEKESLIEL